MTADAIKLLCRAFKAAVAKEYSVMYDVQCTSEEDEMLFINMVELLETTCALSYDTTCYLEKIVGSSPDVDEFDDTVTVSCTVSITDTTPVDSCASPPTISVA
jgi:hypothetical protein